MKLFLTIVACLPVGFAIGWFTSYFLNRSKS